MDRLPKELWVLIFSFSQDMIEIIQVLPQVCARMNQAFQDHHIHFLLVNLIVQAAENTDDDSFTTQISKVSAALRLRRARGIAARTALESKNLELFKDCLKAGLDINLQLSQDHQTALFVCTRLGWTEGLLFLLERDVTFPPPLSAPNLIRNADLGHELYLGWHVVVLATKNLMMFPEFSPLYTTILYHHHDCFSSLLTHPKLPPNYVVSTLSAPFPALLWNKISAPVFGCGTGAGLWWARNGHTLLATTLVEGTHWTVVEQELRRPDSNHTFIKSLLGALNDVDRKSVRAALKPEHFIKIIQTKNLAIEVLSQPDFNLETAPEISSVGWLGISHQEETLKEWKSLSQLVIEFLKE